MDERKSVPPLRSGIDRRRHDDDYADRIVRGARLERVRSSETNRDSAPDESPTPEQRPRKRRCR